jgi:hypothetical protein
MQIRLYEKGTQPPPASDGVVGDISCEQLPAPGDVIQLEGRNAEVTGRYRVTGRLFRAAMTGESTELAVEVEPISD